MNVVVIVQARFGSTRLPGKILKKVLDKELLVHQIERIKRAKLPDNVVVATTILAEDNQIVKLCESAGFDYFRGHPTDLLNRHYKAGNKYNADVVVKIPSDCPLIDPEVIDNVIGYYLDNQNDYDFVSNLHPCSYPDGNDVEVIPMKILYYAWRHAEKSYELEHTTPYIWDNPEIFRVGNVLWEKGLDYSGSHRFTLDYQEDFDFIKRVYEEIYPDNPDFSLNHILNLLETKPEIMNINNIYAGDGWYKHHIDELKTIYEQVRIQ